MIHKRVTPLLALLVALLATGTACASSVIVVSFNPSDTVVERGDTFTVDIVATILEDSAIVGWGMDVSFDTSLVFHDSDTGVALGPMFDAAPGPVGDEDGLIGLVPIPSPVWGDGIVLATLTFTATELGVTDLLGSYTDGDPWEGFYFVGGDMACVDFMGGTITIVPLPTALLAGLAGLALVPIAGRRFRR